jgi:hypothetical protein
VWLSLDSPRRNPKHPRRGDGINSPPLPPHDFVSGAMDVAVMGSAQRHRELVADLSPHRAGLGEPQMMGLSRASAAHQTRLRCNELEVRLIAMPTRLADRELALLDFVGSTVGLMMCRSRRTVVDGWLRWDRNPGRLLHRGFGLSRAPPWPPRLGGFRWC